MTEDQTRLGQMILSYWRDTQPDMLAELSRSNLLSQTLSQTEERTAELLHELVAVRKMQYQSAWEIAMQEWALPPTGDRPLPSTLSLSPPRRATSE